eukprot:4807180-Prymnesium_polylepis.1
MRANTKIEIGLDGTADRTPGADGVAVAAVQLYSCTRRPERSSGGAEPGAGGVALQASCRDSVYVGAPRPNGVLR